MTSLSNLESVPVVELHQRAVCVSKTRVESEWELAHLLLALEERRAWSELGCVSVADYAEKNLALGPPQIFALLRLAGDLGRFPKLDEAWRTGEVSRSKLREICRVVTEETEDVWLEFARTHSCREVERKVVLSPRAAARVMSTEVRPAVTSFTQQAQTVQIEEQPLISSRKVVPQSDPVARTTVPCNEETVRINTPLIRVSLTFEPAEYAVVEAALDLMSAKIGGRRRERLIVEMAQRILQHADARTRRRHAIVVEKDATTGSAAYATDRGYLPASIPDRVTEQRERVPETLPGGNQPDETLRPDTSDTPDSTKLPSSRTQQTPTATHRRRVHHHQERETLERAGFVCERCGRSKRLHIHHRQPRCDGGGDQASNLQLLCVTCHEATHAKDFAEDVRYIMGKARRTQAAVHLQGSAP